MSRRSVYADKLQAYPDLVFSDGAEVRNRGSWRSHFGGRAGPSYGGRIILEIGCADGALLTTCAAAHPGTAFVGLDWKFRVLHHAAQRSADLPNVAYLRARAQDLSQLFGPGELDEIWLFHPEPFAAPAQLPNRLFAEPFLLAAHHVLNPGGTLTLKTDHPGYFQWALALLGIREPELLHARLKMKRAELVSPADLPVPSCPAIDRFDVVAVSADFWNDPAAQTVASAHAFAGQTTLYESRFVRKRLPIYYLGLAAR